VRRERCLESIARLTKGLGGLTREDRVPRRISCLRGYWCASSPGGEAFVVGAVSGQTPGQECGFDTILPVPQVEGFQGWS
jgi:hypothetical protein